MDSSIKRDWKLLVIAIIAAILSMVGANSAFMIGIIGVPSAFVAIGRRLFDTQKRDMKMKIVAYGGCILLFVSGPGGCAINTYRVEKAAEPIIQALEQLRNKNGIYPKKEEVEPLLLSKSYPCTGGRFYYLQLQEGADYDLTCVTFGFNKHSYQRSRKQWKDWD